MVTPVVDPREAFKQFRSTLDSHSEGVPISRLLPLLFRLKSHPYSLEWSHFMFEPMFRTKNTPRVLILKCGRQVSKSTSLAANQILRAFVQPDYNILTVMPLFEQVRKFSQNYVRPFIITSGIKSHLIGDLGSDSVLQRAIGQNSSLFYSYSSGDPNRVRGIPADECNFDECCAPNTKVMLAAGGTREVAELLPGDEIVSFAPSTDMELSTSIVQRVLSKGARPCWRVTLENDSYLECTDNERIYTTQGWRYLSEIWPKTPTDHATPSETIEESERLVGCLADEGGYRHYGVYRAAGHTGVLTARAAPRTRTLASNEDPLWERHTSSWPTCESEIPDVQAVRVYHRSDTGIQLSPIASVEYIGEQEVYDVEVDGEHTLFANGFAVHNCQDLDLSDIPIIESCMGASRYKIIRYTGTPKTFDNTIHLLWDESSQAHWHIPCICGKENKAAVDGDLLGMIGDNSKRKDGSNYTLICAKCSRQLNSREGYYVHEIPERRATFPGYHAPQPILPMHYESPKDWQVLLDTMRDKPKYIFYNEVLGESLDSGSKVITHAELYSACVTEPCEPKEMPNGQYISQAIGVDWGGRGKEKSSDTDDFISNTALALAGMLPSGVIEVKWLHKVPYETDMSHEAVMAANVSAQSQSEWLAMDYGGQGNVQEQQVLAAGWPQERVVPFTYSVMSPTKPIVFYNPPKHRGVRASYSLDKPRSILLLAELIKRGLVLLPNLPKYKNDHLRDFLNIYEETIDNPSGSPRRLIKRMTRRTDDVVHAINFAVMALYHSTQMWPKVAEAFVEGPVNQDA